MYYYAIPSAQLPNSSALGSSSATTAGGLPRQGLREQYSLVLLRGLEGLSDRVASQFAHSKIARPLVKTLNLRMTPGFGRSATEGHDGRPATGPYPLSLHSKLPEQERINIRELFDLLRHRFSCPMTRFRLDSQQDRARLAFAVLGFGLHQGGHLYGVHRVDSRVAIRGHK